MYIARNRSIKVCISLYTREGKAEVDALLDSKATENLIHPQLIERTKVKKKWLKKERKLFNVDGSQNLLEGITETALLLIKSRQAAANHRFLITDIGEDDLILGYPFFEAINPQIDWPTGTTKETITLLSHDEWDKELPKLENIKWVKKVMIAQQLAEKAVDKKKRT